MYLYNNPNSYRDVAQYHQLENVQVEQVVTTYNQSVGCRIIGIKDLTDNAGATTLTYILAKELKRNYNVLAVEVDSNDFNYFNDRKLMTSVLGNQVSKFVIDNKDKDVIFIDVNNNPIASALVQEMIYLVEPSTLKLNKLMYIRRRVFKELENQKIILNKSLLSKKMC